MTQCSPQCNYLQEQIESHVVRHGAQESAKDLPKEWLTELQDFFVNYHNLEGKKYKLLGCKGEEVALRLIKKAQRAA
jgi:inorganic pyrophosphatase